MKVVDASVVLGWLLPESPSPESQSLRKALVGGSEHLAAPELLRYEIANVLATKTALSLEEAFQAWDVLTALGIETYALGEGEHREAVQLARKHRISAYDASYVVLADRLKSPIVTADRAFAAKIGKSAAVEVVTS